MAEIKFYSDVEKQNQVYPALDPDKEYNITVKAADNLTSPDMSTVRGNVNFRSSGEGADIGTGIAKIEKIKGDAYSTAVPREFEDRLNATGITGYSINEDVFIEEVGQSGTYDFVYTPIVTTSSPNVTITNNVAFATWKNIGNYSFKYMPDYYNPFLWAGMNWTLTFTNKVTFFEWTWDNLPNGYSYPTNGYFILSKISTEETFSLKHSNTGNVIWTTISPTMFRYRGLQIRKTSDATSYVTFYIQEASQRVWAYGSSSYYSSIPGVTYNGTPSLGESITINYSANEWYLNNNAVNLADYGIANLEGTPIFNDIIEVYYKARIIGNVITANNPNFKSIYINQFDKNNNIFEGYIIDADTTYGIGEIVQGQGSVGFFRCLKNQTYTFYFDLDERPQEEDPLGFVCYHNRKPQITPAPTAGMTLLSTSDIASSGQVLNNNWKTSYYTPNKDGWLVFEIRNNIEHLYCHLTWSGYKDKITNEYEEDIINLQPLYTNINLPFGLLKVNDNCYDEIDFVNRKTIQRVERVDYSSTELGRIQGLTDEYIYDNNYIYYNIADDTGIRENNFPSSFTETGEYNVDDFGIECIINSDGSYIDKDLKFEMDIAYQENLKDKLRRSVEVISNKTSEINADSTDIQYSTAKAVYDMNLLLRSFFGINVNTYANTKTYEIGDYVVYNLKLYKCTTKITQAENWNLSHWTESQFFKLI